MRAAISLAWSICMLTTLAGAASPRVQTNQASTNPHAVSRTWYQAERKALALIPQGGKYSTSKEAFQGLIDCIRWDSTQNKLHLDPQAARPSFCSSACYLLLLLSLHEWEKETQQRFPATTWTALLPYLDQKDGVGIWGRANANGPGFAKLIHDLGAGYSFENYKMARAGDFVKLFWSEHIGGNESGHLTLFLSYQVENGVPCMSFWSSNLPDGYGKKTIPMSQISRMLFTRITQPAAFTHVDKLSGTDEWLQSLLKKPSTIQEVRQRCGMQAP